VGLALWAAFSVMVGGRAAAGGVDGAALQAHKINAGNRMLKGRRFFMASRFSKQ
jgi:hypothetical protein